MCSWFLLLLVPRPPLFTLFPYTTLFRSPLSIVRTGRTSSLALAPTSSGNGSRAATSRRSPRTATCSGGRRSTGWFSTTRSEEHTSELQSRFDLVCRLLLEQKKYDVVYYF